MVGCIQACLAAEGGHLLTGEKSNRGTVVLEFYPLSPPQRLIIHSGIPCINFYIKNYKIAIIQLIIRSLLLEIFFNISGRNTRDSRKVSLSIKIKITWYRSSYGLIKLLKESSWCHFARNERDLHDITNLSYIETYRFCREKRTSKWNCSRMSNSFYFLHNTKDRKNN